jgi:alkylation response protein AidB-like acyl-CoA dehydrogenase
MVVVDGHVADLLLVVAETDRGLALFRVDAEARGLERAALPAFDPTRKIARISFEDVEAEILSTPSDQSESVERAMDLCTVALASEQLGGAQRCLDSAVEYARTRIQFGRPIGSFQAIKHRCADLLIEVEFSRSAVVYAAHCAAGEDPVELRTAASMAKAYCSEAYTHAADANLQIHGGMGYTWEHSAHLYLKRARSSAVLLGDAAMHRERVADQIGL